MAGKDRLTEAHERLTAAVDSLVSGEDWQGLLSLAARLYRYSPNNCLLIRAQRPDATWLAGYRRWQALGRQVRKGEKGVAILAPIVSRRRPVDHDEEAQQPGLVRVLRGFTVAHIFDVSQTDGPPLPEVGPALLDGDAPAQLWERLAAQVAGAGFTLTRGDCRPANGKTDFVARAVTVRDDVTDAQAAKTLAHDLLTAPGLGPPLGRRDLFEWSRPYEDEEGRDDATAIRPGQAPGCEQAGDSRRGWVGGDLDPEWCTPR